MDSVYFLLALAIILALFWTAKQRRIAAIRHVLNRNEHGFKHSRNGQGRDGRRHRAGKGRQCRSGQSGIRHAHP